MSSQNEEETQKKIKALEKAFGKLRMGHGMSKVLPCLYLGNLRDSKDSEQLRKHQISHVLAIHDQAAPIFPKQMKYLCIQIPDTPSSQIQNHFSEAINFIHQARTANHNVLVHCLCGISRSTTLVVAYLMTIADISWQDALRCVKYVRSSANPNLGFQSQLQKYQQTNLSRERDRVKETYPTYDPLRDQLLLNRNLKSYEKFCSKMDEEIFPVPAAGRRRYSWAVGKGKQDDSETGSPVKQTNNNTTLKVSPKCEDNSESKSNEANSFSKHHRGRIGSLANQNWSSEVVVAEFEKMAVSRLRVENSPPENNYVTNSVIDPNESISRSFAVSERVASTRPKARSPHPSDTISVHSDVLPLRDHSLRSSYWDQEPRYRKRSTPIPTSHKAYRDHFGRGESLESNYHQSLSKINSGEYYSERQSEVEPRREYDVASFSGNNQSVPSWRKLHSYSSESWDTTRKAYRDIPADVRRCEMDLKDEDYDADEEDHTNFNAGRRNINSLNVDHRLFQMQHASSTPNSPRMRHVTAPPRDDCVRNLSTPRISSRDRRKPQNFTQSQPRNEYCYPSPSHSRRGTETVTSRSEYLSFVNDSLDSKSRSVQSLPNPRYSNL